MENFDFENNNLNMTNIKLAQTEFIKMILEIENAGNELMAEVAKAPWLLRKPLEKLVYNAYKRPMSEIIGAYNEQLKNIADDFIMHPSQEKTIEIEKITSDIFEMTEKFLNRNNNKNLSVMEKTVATILGSVLEKIDPAVAKVQESAADTLKWLKLDIKNTDEMAKTQNLTNIATPADSNKGKLVMTISEMEDAEEDIFYDAVESLTENEGEENIFYDATSSWEPQANKVIAEPKVTYKQERVHNTQSKKLEEIWSVIKLGIAYLARPFEQMKLSFTEFLQDSYQTTANAINKLKSPQEKRIFNLGKTKFYI